MNQTSSNEQKHTSKNILQQWLINRFYAAILGNMEGLSVETILDAGCGEGFTLERIHQAWPNKYQLAGVDISTAAINGARQKLPFIPFKEGSVDNLPYPDNAYDLVICNEVLEHVENPTRVLQEIHRVTKKYTLLSVPNEPWFQTANFLRGKDITRWGNNIEHIQHWSPSQFQSLVTQHGFRILNQQLPFPWIIITAEK